MGVMRDAVGGQKQRLIARGLCTSSCGSAASCSASSDSAAASLRPFFCRTRSACSAASTSHSERAGSGHPGGPAGGRRSCKIRQRCEGGCFAAERRAGAGQAQQLQRAAPDLLEHAAAAARSHTHVLVLAGVPKQ